MAAQVWMIADRSSAVIQAGQPPAQQAAWLLDIPSGSTAMQTAASFAAKAGFPVGTVARIIDLSVSPLTVQTFTLTSQWVSS